MTEEQIERAVEQATDRLDERFLANRMTEREYRDALDRLDRWAEEEYAKRSVQSN